MANVLRNSQFVELKLVCFPALAGSLRNNFSRWKQQEGIVDAFRLTIDLKHNCKSLKLDFNKSDRRGAKERKVVTSWTLRLRNQPPVQLKEAKTKFFTRKPVSSSLEISFRLRFSYFAQISFDNCKLIWTLSPVGELLVRCEIDSRLFIIMIGKLSSAANGEKFVISHFQV